MSESMQRALSRSFRNDALNLIILPTEKCNFRCVYCYERFDKGKMSTKVVSGISNLIENRADELKKLEISWFGGEPTLCPDIIETISEKAIDASKKSEFDFNANMTTNGFLLSRGVFERYVELGVTSYQITLDGYEEDHDKLRKKANGSGTFQTIWKNLLEIRQTPLNFQIFLRVHFLQDGWEEKSKLLSMIAKEFGDDQRFKVHIIAIGKFGSSADAQLNTAGAKKEEILANLRSQIPQHMVDAPEITSDLYVCYASKGNSFVIRSDGSLSKCTVGLYNDKNMVGRITDTGKLHVDNEKMRPWFNGFESGDKKALACPAREVLWK